MAYEKTNWIDRIVDPETGKVIQAGTPINSANMNHIEDGIANCEEEIKKCSDETPEYRITEVQSASYAKSYKLQVRYADGEWNDVSGQINIPKDMVVSDGTVKKCTEKDKPISGLNVGDAYLDLTIANSNDKHIYINAKDLGAADKHIGFGLSKPTNVKNGLWVKDSKEMPLIEIETFMNNFKTTDKNHTSPYTKLGGDIGEVIGAYEWDGKIIVVFCTAGTGYASNHSTVRIASYRENFDLWTLLYSFSNESVPYTYSVGFYNGRIYFLGFISEKSYSTSSRYYADGYIKYYDLTNGNLVTATTSGGIAGCCTCTYGKYIYMFGGVSGNATTTLTLNKKVYKFNCETNTLSEVCSTSYSRTRAAAVLWKNYIYVFGGVTNTNYMDGTDSVLKFNPSADSVVSEEAVTAKVGSATGGSYLNVSFSAKEDKLLVANSDAIYDFSCVNSGSARNFSTVIVANNVERYTSTTLRGYADSIRFASDHYEITNIFRCSFITNIPKSNSYAYIKGDNYVMLSENLLTGISMIYDSITANKVPYAIIENGEVIYEQY